MPCPREGMWAGVDDSRIGAQPMTVDGLVSVRDLHKAFRSGEEEVNVLRGVNLEVTRGELFGIVGASGVGKSTLLHLMGGLDRPTKGEVLIKGTEVFDLSDNELSQFRNRYIGFIFQFHHLLPEFSALENTMMPAIISGVERGESKERAEELLREVGLADRMRHRPGELSGGECQRVAVARALVNSPEVVLADEPTGNLDSKNSGRVQELLRRLNEARDRTFIIVTHDQGLAATLDRFAYLVDGQIKWLEKGVADV